MERLRACGMCACLYSLPPAPLRWFADCVHENEGVCVSVCVCVCMCMGMCARLLLIFTHRPYILCASVWYLPVLVCACTRVWMTIAGNKTRCTADLLLLYCCFTAALSPNSFCTGMLQKIEKLKPRSYLPHEHVVRM